MKSPSIKENPILYGLGFLALVIIIVVIFLFSSAAIGNMGGGPKGKLNFEFSKSSIKSEETTFLSVQATNTGEIPMIGSFQVTADDSEAVSIVYPENELLSFKLYPGESIKRRINISGTSKAVRTDYEIYLNIVGNNETIIDEGKVTLTVTRED